MMSLLDTLLEPAESRKRYRYPSAEEWIGAALFAVFLFGVAVIA